MISYKLTTLMSIVSDIFLSLKIAAALITMSNRPKTDKVFLYAASTLAESATLVFIYKTDSFNSL